MANESNATQRHLMLITRDEKLIEHIRANNNPSLYQTVLVEPGANTNDLANPSSSDDKSSSNRRTSPKNSFVCVICGSLAHGHNFGVITCESCKLFFRRNGLRNPASLFCPNRNQCEIKLETRRHCASCRLIKCLNSGMKRDRLLRAKRRQQTEGNKHLLSTSKLTPEEFDCIEFIQIAFERRIELAAHDGLIWNSSIFTTTFPQHLNARSVPPMHLLAFFKQIPEFNQININDQMILIKYNLMPLIILNSSLSFQIDSQQILETDPGILWNSSSVLKTVHGQDIYLEVSKVFQSFVSIAKYDPKILQLVLIIFILSKGFSASDGLPEPILYDNMSVYHAQSFYIELLWKYMEIRYSFEQAFEIYTMIITRFLTWQLVEKKLKSNVEQNLSKTDENDLLPLMKALSHM